MVTVTEPNTIKEGDKNEKAFMTHQKKNNACIQEKRLFLIIEDQ